MRYLADESLDFSAVRALRQAGHDVTAVAEVAPGATDDEAPAIAGRGDETLLTEDEDFGQLIEPPGPDRSSVVFVRYPATARGNLGADVGAVQVLERTSSPVGRFVVLEPGRLRI